MPSFVKIIDTISIGWEWEQQAMLEKFSLAVITTFSLYFFLQVNSGNANNPDLVGNNLSQSSQTIASAVIVNK